MKYKLMILLMFVGLLPFAVAQSDTGMPTGETMVAVNPYLLINLGNLNVVAHAPLRSKSGPVPFNSQINQNVQPYVQGTNTFWNTSATPFSGQPDLGYWGGKILTEDQGTDLCPDGQTTQLTLIVAVYDERGTYHPLSGGHDSRGCIYPTIDVWSPDGSGLEAVIPPGGNPTTVATIYNRNGMLSTIHTDHGSVTDQHGNSLTITHDVPTNTSTYADELTATPAMQWVEGSHVSTYKYTDGTGALRSITANWPNTTYAPAFTCSGLVNPSSTQIDPLGSVVYPDGSSVTFHYGTDGRLSTMQVPTGATYTFGYSGGTSNQGLWCFNTGFSLAISNATMTVSNGTGTWTFARTIGTGTYPYRNTTTTVTRPDGSKTVYSFRGDLAPILTGTVVYDTNGTTVLDTWTYCYDSTIASCNPQTQLPQNPAWLRQYHTVPGVTGNAEIDTQFDTKGNVTEIDRFDFGPTLVNKTLTTYGDWNGSACVTMSSAHITDKPCEVFTKDASNNVLTHSRFDYNTSTGDLLHTYAFYDATHFLTSTAAYNANGTVSSASGPDGVATTFAYNGTGGCNSLLATSVTNAVGTESMTWDCNGSLPLTSTGLNGLTSTTTYGDSMYRVTQVSDNGGQAPVLYTYPSVTRSSKHMTFNGGASIEDTTVQLDTLGRLLSLQTQTAPSSANYDTVSYGYNSTGRVNSVNQACTTTLGGTCTTPAVSYTYDGMGRLKTRTVNTATHGVLTYTYPAGDVKAVLTPAPTGENSKITQIEKDGLGRTTRICQVITSGLSGGGACGERTAATGYLTKYTLDPLGRATTVSRNAQATPVNSTATYDFLSRVLTSAAPESGTTTSQYDTVHNDCTAPLAGHLNRTLDAVGNETCLTYDSVGRLSAVTFPAGSYAAVTPQKHFQYDSNTKGGMNLIGELARGYTCFSPCSTIITDEQFGKDEYGRTTDVWQNSTGLGSGFFHTTASYFDNGATASVSGIPGSVTGFSYGLDGEGRAFSAIVGPSNVVTSVAYDAAGAPTTVTYSTGDADVYSWDAPSRNMTQYQFKVGAALTTDTGTLTWNPNGTLKQLQIVDNLSSLDNQTCLPGHDDLMRISLYNCGAVWNETYTYSPDYAGNVTKSGSLGFVPGYAPATNRFLAPYTYDANGNLKHDATLGIDYSWDASGSIISIGATSMLNDAFGRSVQAGPSGYYLYTPIGLAGGATSLTAMSSGFVRLPGGATQTFVGASQFTLHTDHTGSARMASNFSARTFNQLWSLGPMGEVYKGTNTNPMYEGIFSYTVTGLYDYLDGAARYSGTWGRTVSPTGGANGYVKNNSPF